MQRQVNAPGSPWPEAVVFDLDGTLVDSAPDIAAALNTVLQGHDLPQFSLDDVTRMIGGGVPKLVERALRALGRPDETDLAARLIEAFLPVYSAAATERTTVFPGVREVLERFAGAGVKMGVCTNKPEGISRQILSALDLARYIGAVVGGDSGPERKPHPAPLLSAFEALGVAPAAGVMVGDSGADAGAARAAGVPVVLVSFGYTQTPVGEIDCDRVIDRFDALEAALAELRPAVGQAADGPLSQGA
ncbi:MAG: phosphoglycolate phosphatase [Hyphomicrobiales bacterium]|nr:phosphoglycolate phosphatase [Hyphomicrobiales bacterium]